MSNLNSLLESSNQWRVVQGDAARLAKKWEKTGLLEGLGGETERNNMALILENQAKQLVVEASQTGGGTAGATFNAGTGEQWAGIALPLVRKVFGQIAAKDFVSVQPMNLPSGLVFFLDFQYGTDKSDGKFNAGGDVFGNGSMYGITDTTSAPTDGLYGAGRWTYSVNLTSSADNTATITSASWVEVGYDSSLSASVAASDIFKVTIASASVPANADLEGVRGWTITSASAAVTAANNLPQFNRTLANGNVELFFIDTVTAAGTVVAVTDINFDYALQPADNNRGDFEDANGNLNGNNVPAISIPEINVKMKSEAIVAKTRKLKAVWTPEFAQDLNAYHSIDAEAELTSIMSEYISMEIDLEILDMLIQNALTTEYWSAVNNVAYDGTSDAPSNSDLGFFNTQGQWFQTLGTKLQKVSNKIHQLTLRGGANFLVMSPTVATILESIPGFAANSDGDAAKMKYAFGVQKIGQLNNRYEVFKNPYMTENVILMGYRGNQFLETGATFSPYIPLIMTPLVYDPDTFTPRKGLLTRYTKKMVRPEYYGKVYVNGLNTL